MRKNTYYHYTSIEALFSVIQSRTVWASSLALMNDEKEGYDLLQLLEEVLNEKHGADKCQKALALIEQFIETYIRHQFAFSASKLADDITQWRAYTELGKGVCIEFSDGFIADEKAVRIECIYGDELKKSALSANSALSSNDDDLEELLSSREGVEQFVSSVVHSLIKFKSVSFSPEQEVHWVRSQNEVGGDSGVLFRPHRLGLTSYRELPVNLSKIVSITLGPRVPRQNLRTVEDFAIVSECGGYIAQSKVNLW